MKLQILTFVAEKNDLSHIQMFLKDLIPLELSDRLYVEKIIKLLFLIFEIVISFATPIFRFKTYS